MPDFPPSSARLERLIKLTDPVSGAGIGGSGFTIADGQVNGLYTAFTLASPGTTYNTVFTVTGQGYILGLFCIKPASVNSVYAALRLTIDGVLLSNGGALTTAATAARFGPGVGVLAAQGSEVGTGYTFSMPVLIPFHRSALCEMRFSGDPGAGENITGGYLVVATG